MKTLSGKWSQLYWNNELFKKKEEMKRTIDINKKSSYKIEIQKFYFIFNSN